MRRLVSFSMVALVAATGNAQFASDRPASPPAAAPFVAPPRTTTPTPTPAPSTASSTPSATANAPSFSQIAASTPRPETLPSAHPWYIKPECGSWMIVVKSYSGDQAKKFAEELAQEIRETYKTPAYLFEKGSDEKRKEESRVKAAKEKQRQLQEQSFLEFSNKLRAEAMAKGQDFQETKPSYRVPQINYEEQWCVLIGGWSDMETARKALSVVRTWQPPKNRNLMDRGYVSGDKESDGRRTVTATFINPFQMGFVSRNPVAARTLTEEAGPDPLVLKMNQEEPLTVLKIQKPWTIVVKSFHAPLVDLKDKDAGSVMSFRKLFNSRPEHLDKTAELGLGLAKMLRSVKPTAAAPQAQPYESYVLHTLNGTLVCVGQFDAPDDPKLIATQQRLETLRFTVEGKEIYPFDVMVAMRVK